MVLSAVSAGKVRRQGCQQRRFSYGFAQKGRAAGSLATSGFPFLGMRRQGQYRCWLSAVIGLSLGWIGVTAFSQLLKVEVVGLLLVVAGGLLYSAGAIVYARRRPDPAPDVFGYHELFHVFTLAAAGCHFAAIAFFVQQAGQLLFNTDTGEVVKVTPHFDPDFAAVICPALGGNPA